MTRLTAREAKATWESAAPGWVRWEDVVADGLRSATETLLDVAGVGGGMRVLDLACGAGSQTFQAANRVGAGGKVVASDISSTMLAHVREKARRLDIGNVDTLEGAAEDLSASPRTFDAAICRLGLMLFPAPLRAARAVNAALKPGARFAALVFTVPERNPFMARPMQILLRHAGKGAPPADAPGIFSLGAPGRLESTLTESGYFDVGSTVLHPTLRLDSAAHALEMMQGAFGAYRAVVADLTDEARRAAWSEVGEYLSELESGSGWETELEVVVASGRTPG